MNPPVHQSSPPGQESSQPMQQSSPPALETKPSKPPHRRTGKVACLPKQTRDQINSMLSDGVRYADIILRLGDAAAGLNVDTIRTWKRGGFQDWLHEQQALDAWRYKCEFAIDLARQHKGTIINEATQQILATQICQVITELGPDSLRAALAANPQTYLRLVSALPRMTSAQLRCDRFHAQQAQAQLPANPDQAESPDSEKSIRPQTMNKIQSDLRLL